MKSQINEIKKLLESNVAEALEKIQKIMAKDSDKELLTLRAMAYQTLNRNTDAINDYIEILKKYGSDEKIENQKNMLETIVGSTQLDIYACTNLHNDPWD